jgi:glycosyltransferase involved in cell wall biosynthesis
VDIGADGGEIMLADNYMGLAIVTMRNGLTYSRPCLKSLQRQTEQPLLILAVDNSSNDGTAAWLRAEQRNDPNLRVMTHGEPLSVAAMWNRALEWGWKQGFEEATVINNDTCLLPSTVGFLQSRQPQAGMTTCISVRSMEELAQPEDPKVSQGPDFSCYLIRQWAWKRIGGFDESYKIAFGEDCEAHVRMHRLGIEALNVGLPFYHVGSGTLKLCDPWEGSRVRRQADRNRQSFFSKWGKAIGTKGYEELFSPSSFGVDKVMATLTEPL